MSMFLVQCDIVLASASLIRQQLLSNAGIEFRAIKADINEEIFKEQAIQKGMSVVDMALKLAEKKACDVSQRYPNAYVIGADQILVFNNIVYNKPQSRMEMQKRLFDMRDAMHTLVNGCVVVKDSKTLWRYDDEISLKMRYFSDDFIYRYLEKQCHMITTTVGGYDLEGLGIHLFEEIKGDYFSIMGLPLLPLLTYFREKKLYEG